VHRFLTAIGTVVFVLARPLLGEEPVKASPQLQKFQEQVDAYLKVRKAAADQLPKLKSTPSAKDLADLKNKLAVSLMKARAGARQGMIFTPEIATEFRRLGQQALAGAAGTRVEKSLKRSDPVQGKVRVNQAYPPAVPLQSMPPTLLMGLPKLPMELEYRLVSKTLILRDVEANLIVDYLPEAIP